MMTPDVGRGRGIMAYPSLSWVRRGSIGPTDATQRSPPLRHGGKYLRPDAYGEAVDDGSGATATAELRDARGQAWHGLLAAVALSSTEREAMFRMTRASQR